MTETLLPLQQYTKDKIHSRKKTAVLARPGAGKTRPILEALNEHGALEHPVLVVGSGPSLPTWQKEAIKWLEYPEDQIHIVRGDNRRQYWERAAKGEPGLYITNNSIYTVHDYNLICQIPWAALILDEYHRYARRHNSKTTKKFLTHQKDIPFVIVATGSTSSRSASEMWTAFRIADPQRWRSYWKYMNTFHIMQDNAWGGSEVLTVKNVDMFKELVDEYFAFIPDEVVASQQPQGKRIVHDVEMTPRQRRIYRELQEDMVSEVGDNLLVSSTSMHSVLHHRQLLCSPRLFDPNTELGAGLEYLIDQLQEEPHVIIFVPFRLACDVVKSAVEAAGFGPVSILRGQMDRGEHERQLEQFEQHRGVLVCTIDYAESWDATTCEKSWFLGYSFRLDGNRQCEGRTQRVSNKHLFLTWNYIKYKDSLDEYHFHNLGLEVQTTRRLNSRPISMIEMLQGHIGN